MSVFGIQADPVCILPDGNMGPDEFKVHPVSGLGIGTNIDTLDMLLFSG